MIISFMLKYSTLSEPTHQFFSKVPLSTHMHFSNTLHFLTTHLFQRNYGLHGAKSCQNAPTQPYLDTWIVQILKSTSILMTASAFIINNFICTKCAITCVDIQPAQHVNNVHTNNTYVYQKIKTYHLLVP